MERENLNWQTPDFQEEKSTWEKIFGSVEHLALETKSALDNSKRFEELLERNLEPNLSPEEISVRMVSAAFEIDFGETVRYDLDYAKMIGVVASALRSTPEMRVTMLAVANRTLRKKLNLNKKTLH